MCILMKKIQLSFIHLCLCVEGVDVNMLFYLAL